jgi:hypothetical protein
MIGFANSQNLTWDYTAVGYWSTIEVHTGIVFACLPAIRSLQQRIFPKARSPNSYYPGGYGYNSKGGSPFPSIVKHGKHQKMEDSGFSQFDEEQQLDAKLSQSRRGDLGRASTHTEIQRGSMHTEDDVELLPIQGVLSSPPPVYHKSDRLNEKVVERGNGWTQGIKVKKDYTVTVESDPIPGSPSSSEETMGRRSGKRGSGQSEERIMEKFKGSRRQRLEV